MAKCKVGEEVNYEEDLDCIDFNNYKGMFFHDDPGQKYQDERTGAHFEYNDICKRLQKIKKLRGEDLSVHNSAVSENIRDEADYSRNKINESGVLKSLQSMQVKGKESRNNVCIMHPQIYGSTVDCCNNPCLTEFSGKAHALARNRGADANGKVVDELLARCRSSDKKRAVNGPIKENVPKKTLHKPNNLLRNKETPYQKQKHHEAFEDLYSPLVTFLRQKNIKTLLEESKKLRKTYQPVVVQKVPIEKKFGGDAKSRNTICRTQQDRRTCCDIKVEVKEARHNGPDRFSYMYLTTASNGQGKSDSTKGTTKIKGKVEPVKKIDVNPVRRLKASVVEMFKGSEMKKSVALPLKQRELNAYGSKRGAQKYRCGE